MRNKKSFIKKILIPLIVLTSLAVTFWTLTDLKGSGLKAELIATAQEPYVSSCSAINNVAAPSDQVTFSITYQNPDHSAFLSTENVYIRMTFGDLSSTQKLAAAAQSFASQTINITHSYSETGTFQPGYFIYVRNDVPGNDDSPFPIYTNCGGTVTIQEEQTEVIEEQTEVIEEQTEVIEEQTEVIEEQENASATLSASPTSFTAVSGKTKINWSINVPANVLINVSGGTNYSDTIANLVGSGENLKFYNAGSYYNTWDGKNQFTGQPVPNGTYKIHMAANSSTIGWIYKDIYVKVTTAVTSTQQTESSTNPTTSSTNNKANFYDLNDALYRDAITLLAGRGIIAGYQDGSFKPLNRVNRAEILKIILRAANISASTIEEYKGQACFTDVPVNQWYTGYVCYAEANGIVSGYADGTFKPAQTVTVAEAYKIALTAFKISFQNTDPWYKGMNNVINSNSLFPEYNDRPDLSDMRRDMVAELVTRMLLNKEGSLQKYINDSGSVE